MGLLLDGKSGCVYNLQDRNQQAQKIIQKWAERHRLADVGIGLSGLLPIPGAATAALIGAIAIQGPLIYAPMSKELAVLYKAEVDDHTKRLILDTVVEGAGYDVSIELGVEFMKEIATEIVGELVAGIAVTAIPFVGAIAAAFLDSMVAATLTWRVGTMVSAYYQNGEAWVGNRKETYHVAAKQVGSYSSKVEGRANLDDLSRNNSTIREKQMATVMNFVRMMQKGACSAGQVREALVEGKVPPWILEAVMKKAFA